MHRYTLYVRPEPGLFFGLSASGCRAFSFAGARFPLWSLRLSDFLTDIPAARLFVFPPSLICFEHSRSLYGEDVSSSEDCVRCFPARGPALGSGNTLSTKALIDVTHAVALLGDDVASLVKVTA